MKNAKKLLFAILILILVILVVSLVREMFVWNNGKITKSSVMTQEEVMELLKKGSTYSNYYYAVESLSKDKSKTEYYIKDNIVACYQDSKILRWTNYNTGEEITFWNSEASISHNVKLVTDQQFGYDYSIIANSKKFSFLGEQDFEGRKTILVQVKSDNTTTQFSIDQETGLILKRIDYSKNFLWTQKLVSNRNVKFNIVTDENIQKPDLTNYQVNENK